ncbi:MAG: type II toxin-antitoxin system YafQ family toxin [Rickettsiales bacterium]|nr:type II toxin-antitoxin system YafQ family toxin [Rickettsiales bacterium]
MLNLVYKNSFKKDFKRIKKRGKDLSKLKEIIDILQYKKPLHMKYRNHKLTGNWEGYWELHIEPDWLLIYKIEVNDLIISASGTHADLFE